MPNVLGGGDVAGPASATDNAVARFDGTTGKLIQNSVVTIADTTGAIAGAQSLTAPASTALTLTGGSSGASLVLGQGTTAADITFTPKGTGEFKWTGSTFRQTAVSPDSTVYLIPGYATGTDPNAGTSRGVTVDLINLSATNENGTALTFSNSNQLSSAYIFGQNLSHAGRTGNIIFGTANGVAPTERMRIASTGDVSISSTAASSSAITGALRVAGGIGAGAASVFTDSLIVSGTSPVVLRSTGTTDVSVSAISTLADSSAFVYVQNDARQWTMRVNGADADKFNIRDSTAGADRLTIDSTGAATFAGAVSVGTGAAVGGATAGAGGLAFPASAVAVANANTLDDYEEGTWTPTDDSGAGLSFTFYNASYTKIGRLVEVEASILFPSTASTAGVRITGLPFPAADGDDNTGGLSISATTVGANYYMLITRGTSTFTINTNADVGVTNVIYSGKVLKFFGCYHV